jgi:hypothetical protein
VTEPRLTRRQLGRATLARQLLLERVPLSPVDAVVRVAGLQAQAPLAPYVGLWSRLDPFDPVELSTAVLRLDVVRTHAMRSTIHLLAAADVLAFRPAFQALHRAMFASSLFARRLDGIDLAAVIAAGRSLLSSQAMSRSALGGALATRFPGADPEALAYTVTYRVPLLQAPPRGSWGPQGPARWQALEPLLAQQLASAADLDALVLRYLAAFGPASVADVQTWSGLTRLGEVVERLPLRRYRSESGAELVDLPDADLPPAETPAAPRFLPEYDNVLLSHADRTRVIPDGRPVPLPPGDGGKVGTLLVDGELRGTWRWVGSRVQVQTDPPLNKAESAEVESEGERLAELLASRPSARPGHAG